jgi:predicted alpha/beta superfamily hydrolase/peptidoglycan/xylan/chitin deacetylase (PgdA/CDA1 family)
MWTSGLARFVPLALLSLLTVSPLARAGAQGPREIAITFDDLPLVSATSLSAQRRERVTADLVGAITGRGVPAIGFVNESQLAVDGRVDPRRVELLRQWVSAGLELGNHGYAHLDLHRVGLDEYRRDILRGDSVTRGLLADAGREPRFFRHPFLHTGRDTATQRAVQRLLAEHGYRVAPVTIDNYDYIFARAYDLATIAGDSALGRRVASAYLDYMLAVVRYYEAQADTLFSRRIPQVLLLHANTLNARAVGPLADSLAARGYRFVSLERALADSAYASRDTYVGPAGITWLHRWALSAGRRSAILPGEPAVPAWVAAAAERRADSSGSTAGGGAATAAEVRAPGPAAAPPVTLPNTETRRLVARANGVEYELRVSLPPGYRADGPAYPVMYLLDADYSFAIARGITEHLTERRHLPPVVLVAIAYGGPPAYRLNRTRDYTPTHVDTGGYGAEYQRVSGGAPAFLQFIRDELVPYIGQAYNVSDDRAIAGHSYGGLFVLWTMLTEPTLFRRVIAVSPSIWYDDHLLLRLEAERARSVAPLAVRFYAGVGGRENNGTRSMPADLRRFTDQLRSRQHPGLQLDWRIEEGETHNSVFPIVLTKGLRWIYQDLGAR